ncbi:hypothetical protein BKA61DRAFT_683978 [Leptodontidium sp. MPI-SDFR-AT-0119]|nr:hypothetical protein BKA61DRAFT_683978 [Leptodontidium sp. MPI-SDFR-AT-0119]
MSDFHLAFRSFVNMGWAMDEMQGRVAERICANGTEVRTKTRTKVDVSQQVGDLPALRPLRTSFRKATWLQKRGALDNASLAKSPSTAQRHEEMNPQLLRVQEAKKCIEQRRELLQAAALEIRESLRDRVARLEAITHASSRNGSSVGIGQTISPPEDDPRDKQSGGSALGSSSASMIGNQYPTSVAASSSVDQVSSQNIDPLVTLFDSAIWRRHSSNLAQERISKIAEAENLVVATKRVRTREYLLSGLLARGLLEMIMNATCSWWYTW